MPINYNDPAGGTDSDIGGGQLRTDYFNKKALIEAKKETYFGQLADVIAMPKNMGKTIKQYHYLPLLDDRNVNDQGIDAAGNTGADGEQNITIVVSGPGIDNDGAVAPGLGGEMVFAGTGSTPALAVTDVQTKINAWVEALGLVGGLEQTIVGATEDLRYTDVANNVDGLAYALGYRFVPAEETSATLIAASRVKQDLGNVYGSSKDIGTISGKLPALSENGGRVNRVGFTRVQIEGTITKMGFFDEYTQEAIDFDSDAELEGHIIRESVMGANEMTEDALQIDLLQGAGVVRFAGAATNISEITGVTASGITEVTYEDFVRLAIDLDNNRTPKKTKIITGTRMIDTKTIDAARIMYIGSEMKPSIMRMVDFHDNPAFVPVHKYAAGTNTVTGEIGSVDQFRIVVVPEMMKWEAAGADEGVNAGYVATSGKYDVFPMLVVGEGSFTTIGFQTDGKSVKFKIKHAKPGSVESYAGDPYGETGFYSIKWYYGTMILRSERLAVVYSAARY
jgi:N4-gp56 family major capsid protein